MTSRVDFYLLKSQTISTSHHFICKLVDKAYKQKHRIYIHVADQSQAKLIYDLLWTFNDISFVPHNIYSENNNELAEKTPVLIGYANHNIPCNEILLNLTTQVPEFFMQFQRIIEIVPQQNELQQSGRENYKFYRAQGCEMFTHDLKKN